jgi:hypothetical protein
MKNKRPKRKAGGRPPKFNEPRRPITVTLPYRTLRQLSALEPDRARAIVKVTNAVVGTSDSGPKQVELLEIAPGKAVIVVGPCASLERIFWLKLAQISVGRFLLMLPSGTAIDSLEVAIHDLLGGARALDDRERSLLEELRGTLAALRRRKKVTKAEIILFEV